LGAKVISRKVVCPRCWLSYTGTVAGSLGALGVDCDIVDVGGYSGYAFIINVPKGETDPSGPTAFMFEYDFVRDQIVKGTESLGRTIEVYQDPAEFEPLGREPTPEELERAKKLFDTVRREIDDRDRPVVVWGLPVPDYGVAIGYDGDSYIPVTVYGEGYLGEPVPYYRLQAPGKLQALFFRDEVELKTETIDREALERAVRLASWNAPSTSMWVMGPAALDTWAEALQQLPNIRDYWHGYGGNSYTAQCVRESRFISAEFLRRLYGKRQGREYEPLLEAAECYDREMKLMDEFTRIFPFSDTPSPRTEIGPEHIKRGVEILKKIKPLEEQAVRHMKKTLK